MYLCLITSSRRFNGRRAWEIFFRLACLHVLFWLGGSPERLAELYKTHIPVPGRDGPSNPTGLLRRRRADLGDLLNKQRIVDGLLKRLVEACARPTEPCLGNVPICG